MHPAPKRVLAEVRGTVVSVRFELCADDSYRVVVEYNGRCIGGPLYYDTREDAERGYARVAGRLVAA
jgi:hypothetical protein